jgi:hypothetical protein
MRWKRRKKAKLGLLAGVLAFVAGWAVVALLAPDNIFGVERWKGTLWIHLGSHFVDLTVDGRGLGPPTYGQAVKIAEMPSFLYALPVVFVFVASVYVSHEIGGQKLKHYVSNAMAAGMGYFVAALLAMIASDMQPSLSQILLIGVGVAAAVWLGSTLLGFLRNGVGFIGVTSLGTIFAIGALVLLGGVAVAVQIRGIVAVSFVPAIVGGLVVGGEYRARKLGRHSEYPRTAGTRRWLGANWTWVLAVTVVGVALVIGLNGGV